MTPGAVFVAADVTRHFRQGTQELGQFFGMVCYRSDLLSEDSDGEDDRQPYSSKNASVYTDFISESGEDGVSWSEAMDKNLFKAITKHGEGEWDAILKELKCMLNKGKKRVSEINI